MFTQNFNFIIIMNTSESRHWIIQALWFILIPVNILADENDKLFQFGLFPPISSNGIHCGKTVNTISLNLIGGYSAGSKIFELGGAWNISREYTKGVQIAGLLNYSSYSNKSIQVSGLGNIVATGISPLQIGGLLNIADRIKGIQFSGLVSIAKKVKGVQIGLINYMENGEEGVSIGLINVAKQGGKYEFEVSFSESLSTLLSFRLGTDRFYTIFSGGINYFFNPLEYTLGLGFGTSINWKKHWSNQLEIHAFGITQEKKFINNSTTNIIRMSFPVCRTFNKHIKLFWGPTLNIGLQHTEIVEKAKLSSWALWNSNWDKLEATGWIGLSAGARF